MKRPSLIAFPTAALAVGLLWAGPAAAQSIIKHPGDHPSYSFEAEPHLALDPGGGTGFGPGFRGTVVLLQNGFVSSINNSIGLGFGGDLLFYGSHCHDGCGTHTDLMLPLVMQWNFWLHPDWSVFGEPGVAFHLRGGHSDHFEFDEVTLFVGGRYHFNDSLALTLRLGAPLIDNNVFSIGLSLLL